MPSAESVLAPKFDPRDPALVSDPYSVYARVREQSRVCRGGPGQYVITRHGDVAALLRDARLTKRLPKEYYAVAGATPRLRAFLHRMNMGRRDAELTARVGAGFRAPRVAELQRGMRALVDELLEPLRDRAAFDLASELALGFPLSVMCQLLGIPAADRAEVWPHAAALLASFSDAALLTTRNLQQAERALEWLERYLGSLLAQRRRDPRGDLLSALAQTGSDRRLTDEQIVESAVRVFYAGFETSKALLCNGMHALLQNPGELRRLRSDRTLVPTAVEEFLRYDAPIQITLRVALETIEIGERRIRAGRVLLLLIGSANRDERRFEHPASLDVGRRPNPHVSFGGGPHYCMGAALARQEGIVALEALLTRFRSIEPAGEAIRSPLVNLRGIDSLPVAVRAA